MKINKIILCLFMLPALSSFAQATENKIDYLSVPEVEKQLALEKGVMFPVGVANTKNQDYFTGASYLSPVSEDKLVHIFNVTFAPGTINNWHVHHNSCQVLVGVLGTGYYQIWGEEPKKIEPGQTVTIPAETKHWHGAGPSGYFQHLAYLHPYENVSTQWLEKVDPKDYEKIIK